MNIDRVIARSIIDTRGRATIETTLSANTLSATASVPSGKSTGSHEALELRDADGSVTSAIANVNGEIATALTSRDFATADELDAFLVELDGTPNKSRLGANAILSVSIAAMRLFAQAEGIPLWKAIAKRSQKHSFSSELTSPRLYVNVMNGGVHADFKLPFQEYILVVEGKTSTALPVAQEAFARLGRRLGNVPMGDEGGYAPTFETLEQPFEILAELVKEFPGTSIAIDAAASELFHDGSYHLLGKSYSAEELTTIYRSISERFPLHSIEDPFDEEAADDFTRLTATLGGKVLIIGDDLTVTNPARIIDAVAHKEINAVLIKPNQIGTVREALLAVQETYTAGWKTVASHRSGETDDTFISDFAYGIGAHGIKAGGLGQRERLEKYERLLAIEQEAEAVY
jgi:enolase